MKSTVGFLAAYWLILPVARNLAALLLRTEEIKAVGNTQVCRRLVLPRARDRGVTG